MTLIGSKLSLLHNAAGGLKMAIAIASIMNKLEVVFAPFDATVLVRSQAWAKNRVAAIKSFKESDDAKEMCRRDNARYYGTLFAVAGGKGWYNALNGRSPSMVEEFMVKNCKAIAEKRNFNIAKKLQKVGVTEVISEEFVLSSDGFDGVFAVNTNNGEKRVIINTIGAGGYNIQCYHLRVLVKIK